MSAASHAVRVTLGDTVPADALASRLRPYARLWTDELPFASTDPRARARAERELSREPAPDGAGARALLLRYADGTADLVLVARRTVLDAPALRTLARAAADPGVAPPAVRGAGPAPEPVGDPPAGPAVPAWGLAEPSADPGPAEIVHVTDGPAEDPAEPAAWAAALALVLARYGGENRHAVGVAGDESRTLALRTDAGSLGDLVAAARAGLAGADTGDRAPVPAVGLCLPLRDERLEYRPVQGRPFPLTVTVTGAHGDDGRGASAARLRAAFRPRDFSPAVVARFLAHLETAHRHVLGHPTADTSAADVLTPPRPPAPAGPAAAASAGAGPGPAAPRPAARVPARSAADSRIELRFAEQAAARPGAVAVSDGVRRWTYRELADRAHALARGLRARGVRPGDRVGVCLPRTAELVATLLAVLEAGAAYVPVDPDHPADRLAFTARDAAWRLVVTRREDFPAADRAAPAELAAAGARGQEAAGPSGAGPGDPAYVIYTSGSTGRPKGVVVPHGNVLALMDATRHEYGLGPGDVWTFFHSSAFDFSVWEIWGCLLTGGHLVVVPFQVSRTPEAFFDLLVREGVTVLSQTPTAFSRLVPVARRRPAGEALALRLVVFGGEALDARMLLPWFDRHPASRCRMVNMYGITETTVHVTAQTVTRRMALEGSRSVGRALPGWQVYVRDARGRAVPPGGIGEIVVGGAGVALGYLDRPELTAERFAADPVTGGRTYRSGDLGRLRPDGALEHLGRMDSQVKIRGFRVELDEIRSVLLADPAVDAAVAVVRRHDPDDPVSARVDAYVVPSGTAPGFSAAELRRRAARFLPDHMVPATVTAVAAVPVTPNGKLDADRLPEPVWDAPEEHRAEAAPGDDEVLAALSAVWAELLGREVSPEHNFFELGGNSLLAVRMAALLRDRGFSEVPLRTIYLNPSVRQLASSLRGSAAWTSAPAP